MKALVGAFNQEKALVGAFSVIVQLHRLIDLRHYTFVILILHARLFSLILTRRHRPARICFLPYPATAWSTATASPVILLPASVPSPAESLSIAPRAYQDGESLTWLNILYTLNNQKTRKTSTYMLKLLISNQNCSEITSWLRWHETASILPFHRRSEYTFACKLQGCKLYNLQRQWTQRWDYQWSFHRQSRVLPVTLEIERVFLIFCHTESVDPNEFAYIFYIFAINNAKEVK